MAHNGTEHSLEVEGGTHRLTDLTQRYQLTNRLRQLAGTRLQFLEQPDVLNGDHCLVGKSLEKGYLLIGEGSDFGAANMNRPDRSTFAKQWGRQDRANFTGLPAFGKFRLGLRGRYVMDMNRLFIEHSFANKSTAGHRSSFLWSEYSHRSIRSDKPKRIAVCTPNCRVGRITQPGGIFATTFRTG